MRAIAGHHRPIIVEDVHARVAEDDHGLDGQGHARHQAGALARAPVVGHRGLHVHARSDAVADVLLDDAVGLPSGTHHGLHRMSDVRQSIPGARRGKTGPKGFLGHTRELPKILGHIAHEHREGSITVPAIDDGAAVDGDDIALGQPSGTRDAVDDLLVDRHADMRGEPVIAQEGRCGAFVADGLSSAFVEGRRGHAGRRDRRDALQRAGDHKSRGTHDLDLVRRLDLDAVA